MTKLDPIHPGEILREEFLKEMHVNVHKLAVSIGVPTSRIDQIVKGRRSISADTALRLGAYFKIEPQFWTNLQTRFDLQIAENEVADDLKQITPYAA